MVERFGPTALTKLAAGDVVYRSGDTVPQDVRFEPGLDIFIYRTLPDEVEIPFPIEILHRDDNLLVIDKPHFMSTMPSGQHVRQTALVRLRNELRLPELAPIHRLDRLTAGVLMFAVHSEVRGRYQQLFAKRRVHKIYEAIAPLRADLDLPTTVSLRLKKHFNVRQVQIEDGPVNSITRVELLSARGEYGLYRLLPETGKTHQLRAHLNWLGIPIIGDPLYPEVQADLSDDYSKPLKLLARSIEFNDPITKQERRFDSVRQLVD